jgi:hypothetical protein
MNYPTSTLLKEIGEALGWQGGTISEMLAELKRLKDLDSILAEACELMQAAAVNLRSMTPPGCFNTIAVKIDNFLESDKAASDNDRATWARVKELLRQETRDEIAGWARLNAYKPRNPGLGEFQTVISYFALMEILGQKEGR